MNLRTVKSQGKTQKHHSQELFIGGNSPNITKAILSQNLFKKDEIIKNNSNTSKDEQIKNLILENNDLINKIKKLEKKKAFSCFGKKNKKSKTNDYKQIEQHLKKIQKLEAENEEFKNQIIKLKNQFKPDTSKIQLKDHLLTKENHSVSTITNYIKREKREDISILWNKLNFKMKNYYQENNRFNICMPW